MDQTRARETAKDAAVQAGKTANEAAQQVGEQVQPALDQGKSMAQDLGNRASEAGRQARDRAGQFVESVAPQARQVASNLRPGLALSRVRPPICPARSPRRDVDCRRDWVRARLSRPRALKPNAISPAGRRNRRSPRTVEPREGTINPLDREETLASLTGVSCCAQGRQTKRRRRAEEARRQ